MNRSFHSLLKITVTGIAVMLVLVMFCGYVDDSVAVPERELTEAGASVEEHPDTELSEADAAQASQEKEVDVESACDAIKTEEKALTDAEADSPPQEDKVLSEVSAPEQTPTPAPVPLPTPTPVPASMPMFDIIDGRTIYLSITEEEFIEIAEILRNGLGVNDAALAGIMGNLQGESGFNPHKIGDDGGAYGICQWRGPRLDQMVEYCEDHGLNPVSRDGQLDFLIYDLVNNYIYAYDQIRLCEDSEKGALQATYNFCAYYEVPANPEEESLEREEWTKLLIYPKLNELSEAA